MKQWLFSLAAGVSLMLSLVTVGMWVCSYWASRYVFYTDRFFLGRYDGDREWSGWYLAVYRGGVFYELESVEFSARPTTAPVNRWMAEDMVGLRTPAIRILVWGTDYGFGWVNEYTPGPAGTLYLRRWLIPLWAVFLGTLVLPGWWVVRRISNVSARSAACETHPSP